MGTAGLRSSSFTSPPTAAVAAGIDPFYLFIFIHFLVSFQDFAHYPLLYFQPNVFSLLGTL